LLPELFLHKRQVAALAPGQAAGGLLGQPLSECNLGAGALVWHQACQGFEPGRGVLGDEFFLQRNKGLGAALGTLAAGPAKQLPVDAW